METKQNFFNCPFEIKADEITDSGIFTGYASTFGGKPDSYGDVIAPGAFTKTLTSGKNVKMLWQHKYDEPIGVWKSIVENKTGLKVTGQLAMKTQKGKEAFELMKIGALDAMSIGYFTVDYEINNDTNIRTLKEIDLVEISPVTFPANTSATITQVKSMIEEAGTVRELEKGLRDVGLSKEASKYVASLCKTGLTSKGKAFPEDTLSEILRSLKEANSDILNNNKGA